MFGDLNGDHIPTCSPAIARLFDNADLIIGNYQAAGVDARSVRTTLVNLEIDPQRCVLSVANNRAGDGDASRVHERVDRLRELGVTPVGAINDAATPLTTVRTRGLNIGIAAWTHWLDHDVFAEGEGVATPENVLHRDWDQLKRDNKVDCLIGSPHWEWAEEFIPRQDTIAIAQHLAESGFDILGGHHPGIAQPMEWFSGPGERAGICEFSLGNLGSIAADWAEQLGLVLEAEIITSGENRGQVAAYTLHPIATVETASGPRIVPLRYAPLNLRQRMWQRIALLFDEARYPNKAQPLQAASSL